MQRVFDGGRVMEKHVRTAGIVRGRLTVGQEQDNLRHRTVLVARLLCSGGTSSPVHPLYDVTLVASSGESWTLAGFERIEAGPMRHVHLVGQAWIIEPVAIQGVVSENGAQSTLRQSDLPCQSGTIRNAWGYLTLKLLQS